MIIIDFSQIMINNIIGYGMSNQLNEGLIRHIILNSIREHMVKFKHKFGPDVILACDSRKYWRKDEFQYYKASRKKIRDESVVDWEMVYKYINQIKEELTDNSIYKVIDVPGCEGDDIIAILSYKYSPFERVMIISSDKDFGQLQVMNNVGQYDPIKSKYIRIEDPRAHLKELIIRGDRSDGVPNILSQDDTFVIGKRQKSIMEVKLSVWMNQKPEDFCTDEMLVNYKRNEKLIDLSKIPSNIIEDVINIYDNYQPKTRSEFLDYMIQCRLKNLICDIGDF